MLFIDINIWAFDILFQGVIYMFQGVVVAKVAVALGFQPWE